jgi:hypothetical protein
MINANVNINKRSTPSGSAEIPLHDLVLYLRLDGNLTDQTGNNSASSTGVVFSNAVCSQGIWTGVTQGAACFSDFTVRRIEVADSPLLSFGDGVNDQPFSITTGFWINNYDNANNWICDKRGDRLSGIASIDAEYQLQFNNTDRRLIFTIWDQADASSGTFIQVRSAPNLISTNTPYLVTATYDGSKNRTGMNLYVNSVNVSGEYQSAGLYSGMLAANSPLTLGAIGWANSKNPNNLDGRLDGFGIWKTELRKSQVGLIYDKQSSGVELL